MQEHPVTVAIVNAATPGGFTLINEADFDPAVHTRFDGPRVAAPEPPAAPVDPIAAPVSDDARTSEVSALKTDGPTLEEYVEAGYDAATYPPLGYAEKPSPALDAYRAEQAAAAAAIELAAEAEPARTAPARAKTRRR